MEGGPGAPYPPPAAVAEPFFEDAAIPNCHGSPANITVSKADAARDFPYAFPRAKGAQPFSGTFDLMPA
jgi:hypothetical protein